MEKRCEPEEIERRYRRDGFVHIPVFSLDEVHEIRQAIYACFRRRHGEIGRSGARDLTSRDLLSEDALLCATAHPRITSLLKTLLGEDCVYIPDFEIHINQYIIGRRGWHIDCGSEIPHSYLLEPEYRFVKCGLYLQDNSADLAGGIDVMPGVHRWFPPLGSIKTRFRVQYVLSEAVQKVRARRVLTRAGDFVAFDSRLPHRGTAPSRSLLNRVAPEDRERNDLSAVIPPGRDKMVVYFDACRAPYADSFLENSVRRAQDEIRLPIHNQYRAQYLGLSYPEDFPPEFCRRLNAGGVRMAVYRGPDKAEWVEHWRRSQN